MKAIHFRIRIFFPFILSLLILFSCGYAAHAGDTVYEMGTFYIPEFVENEDSGRFIEVLKEIERRTGMDFGISLRPAKRTISYFLKNRVVGMFPGVDPFFETPVAKSDVIHLKREVIFTRKNDSYGSIRELEGKRVGLTHGYSYSAELLSDPHITFEYASSDVLNMKKLSVGRVDAFVCEETSGLKALKLSGYDNVTYDPSVSIYTQRSYFAFQPDETGKRLAEEFSGVIREMKKDGTLQKILGVSDEWMKNMP